mgnify:CR=1 FL=1
MCRIKGSTNSSGGEISELIVNLGLRDIYESHNISFATHRPIGRRVVKDNGHCATQAAQSRTIAFDYSILNIDNCFS